MLTDWLHRLRSLIKPAAVEQELDDELRFHLEQHVASLTRQGVPRPEAVRRARLALGGLDQIKEEHRDARGVRLADDLRRDLRYAIRQLGRSPGFTSLAVLCLGLGIGVNTSIFGVLHSVLLRPMPVADPDRLMIVNRGQAGSFSYPMYRDLRARSRVLSGLTASFPMESDLEVDGQSEFVVAEVVSANYAAVLGIQPSPGRWFTDDREPVAVISHAVWQRRFNLSPDVIGRRLQSESQSYTIAGVAPPEFTGAFAPLRTDIWVPMQTRPTLTARLEDRQASRMLMLFGRLRAGTTPAQASADLNAIDRQLVAEQGASAESRTPIVALEARGLPNAGNRRGLRTAASLLAVVVALVLMIACVNIGHLLLARGALRQREFAMRRALGATRRRLLQQLLTENLLLAAGGGITGVILARWTNDLLERSVRSLPSVFPNQLDVSLDWRAVAFAAAISLAATILCGFLPAWRGSHAEGLVNFKGEIRGGIPRRRPLGLVAQVVMSLALLLVAGSFLEALLRLSAADPGFAVARRLYAYTYIPAAPSLESGRLLYARALERLRALPGVQSAALTSTLPLMPSGSDCASLPSGPEISITTGAVDTGFFKTMGIAIVAGRGFDAGDLAQGASTVVVTDSLARRLWPGGPSVGERVLMGCKTTETAVVVGVVRDSAIRTLGEPPQPHLYRPFDGRDAGRLTAILLETRTEPAPMVPTVRESLQGLGQGIRVYTVEPLATYIERSLVGIRWEAAVLTGFGLFALLLAAVGLYGVIAYRVSLRTQEIGVRMALGASRAAIFREVVWQGLTIALVGVGIGEVLTLGLTQVTISLQAGIRPMGWSTHVIAGLVWIAVSLLASYVPAARAARVDPLVALRCE